jgi:hypothetical protein
MATSDAEQKSVDVRQHKRMAMGVPITGQTMQAKGDSKSSAKPAGGLSHVANKKKRFQT